MKFGLLLIPILGIIQLSACESPNGQVGCSKYQPINVTASQLAGVWYVEGYGFDGTNEHSTVKCMKRTYTVNNDGVTGHVETSIFIPAKNKSKTFTSPYFVNGPGLFVESQETKNGSLRINNVLYLDNNVLVYYKMTIGCGSGNKTSEPRLASRNPAKTTLSELVTIMKGLPTAADFKEYRDIPQTNCPT